MYLSEDDERLFKSNICLLEDQVAGHFPDVLKAPEILSAIGKVPRHLFADPSYKYLAYTDNALPTAAGLTTSAPSVIAEMMYHSGVHASSKVLEVGTGTGYEAAVLAALGCRVFSIEIDTGLYRKAVVLLNRLGFSDVVLYNRNGKDGCPEHAPFSSIIVAASAASVDILKPLFGQLSENQGRLTAPVGPRQAQELIIVERRGKNDFHMFREEGVTYDFVRLIT